MFTHLLHGRLLAGAALIVWTFSGLLAHSARATTTGIEPDDYADGTALRNVNPLVTLRVQPISGNLEFFVVDSEEGDLPGPIDCSPTGTRVFGHDGINFFSSGFKLRADFAGVTDAVTYQFAGTSSLSPATGRLEAYGSDGTLLDSVQTSPLSAGQFATLSITRPSADIAYTLAFAPVDAANPFGRFDAMSFSTPVPEPGCVLVGGCCAALVLARRGRN